eukprot:CAMPEP_0177651434 /NCGR_PEP_ID=MMETSP0447-20121125/12546_1 /TAXON_ID=0 /ORGANISM="Stygamoeba regulata, Strain BSH-02190019" /LENGTH=290 /DNA_ID=CAMNT_0019154515 /DNA_START=8 /DNA_END=880 /DNA_ORIENTATION=+
MALATVPNTTCWHYVNANGHTVGGLAVKIATLLQGKHKPVYHRSGDFGDYVVVQNVEKVVFTGEKWKRKHYRWHTRYAGGLHEVPASRMQQKDPREILLRAVKQMLPRNRTRENRLKRLVLLQGEDKSNPYLEKISDYPTTTVLEKKEVEKRDPGHLESVMKGGFMFKMEEDDERFTFVARKFSGRNLRAKKEQSAYRQEVKKALRYKFPDFNPIEVPSEEKDRLWNEHVARKKEELEETLELAKKAKVEYWTKKSGDLMQRYPEMAAKMEKEMPKKKKKSKKSDDESKQ